MAPLTPLLLAFVCCALPAQQIPSPRESRDTGASLVFADAVTIHPENVDLRPHAEVLAEELTLLGVAASVVNRDDATIRLRLEPDASKDSAGLPTESYRLEITRDAIVASAASVPGISWATSTLLQCITFDGDRPRILHGIVADVPHAPYRSMSIDVARSPHSIDALRGVVRIARLYKIRFVQLHLTDDQLFTFPFAPVTDKLENNKVFDRTELEALVDYADARGVTLIPEIDLPGHSSRLRQSGYLDDAKTDADVANETHWPALRTMLDDVMDVFTSSPYFHIGGDESGAGRQLVPFLERVNRHVRSRGKRLIVWEGFHGAPTEQLPATGDDRILVAAWESSYNAPWDLLAAGYELVNASWRPLYIVGGDSRIHPGSTAGRSWTPEALCDWNKDRFMHWEPGRPVFEDRGPDDPNRDDGIWNVPKPEWRARVLGGQVSVWEQRESSLLRDLRFRIPVVAERLWSGTTLHSAALMERVRAVDARLWGLVQPVEIDMGDNAEGPIARVAHVYCGDEMTAQFRNRLPHGGEIRWSTRKFGGTTSWIEFRDPDAPATTDASNAMRIRGGASIRAALFRDGHQIGAETWARCVHWPMRVSVTEYAVGRRVPEPGTGRDGSRIPDFDALSDSAITRRYELPMLRGPLDHRGVCGQRMHATLVAPTSDELEIGMKTQSGHAMLWLDLDRDGSFSDSERLIGETTNTEKPIRSRVRLEAGVEYALRVDHLAALPRPVVIVTLDEPGKERPREITQFLKSES